jgi:hypothetical protein
MISVTEYYNFEYQLLFHPQLNQILLKTLKGWKFLILSVGSLGMENNAVCCYYKYHIWPYLIYMTTLILTTIVKVDSIEGLFHYIRLRQCQYSCQNTSKTAPVRPTSVSRFQASPVQSPGLRSGRPSGIPVKTTANTSSRQAKVTQPKQQEGAAVKSLNYMVVSMITNFMKWWKGKNNRVWN